MIYPLTEGAVPRPSHAPTGMMLTDLGAPHNQGYAQNGAAHLLDKTVSIPLHNP